MAYGKKKIGAQGCGSLRGNKVEYIVKGRHEEKRRNIDKKVKVSRLI